MDTKQTHGTFENANQQPTLSGTRAVMTLSNVLADYVINLMRIINKTYAIGK